MSTTKYYRANIASLSPYSTARDEYKGEIGVYLDANENPYNNNYNRYPDPYQSALKARIGEIKAVAPESIFIGNGSDEPIDLVYRIFCEPRQHNAVTITPTYGMYRVAAQINDVELREIALDENFALDADKILAATDSNSRLIVLCSPNNPTGGLLDTVEVEKIIRRFDGIVVIDEAYIDFAGGTGFLPRLAEFPNLVVLQTLSKAWGLAGLRLGLAFASSGIIGTMTRVKYPYNINVLTQKTVLQELEKVAERKAQVAEIIAQRQRVGALIAGLNVVEKIYPSDSNFILVRFTEPRMVYNTLIDKGVIVRDRSSVAGCERCLRITIGTPTENDKLIEILRKL